MTTQKNRLLANQIVESKTRIDDIDAEFVTRECDAELTSREELIRRLREDPELNDRKKTVLEREKELEITRLRSEQRRIRRELGIPTLKDRKKTEMVELAELHDQLVESNR